ncbi:hypothetical protein ADM98_05050 [Exiguobacterium sp. BMC-KP]|uniref:hypothetical protein n=1 Tax=Exiguobacterium sp. BMC-KP TaxID=1684312 RepID=UPI0006AA3163|nr:hypothetical protein [Exiguobacterium sp. BMC-KP]KOP30811.1 hypothetical protein ADM98_05050 [Exiguobacterium sp. BMC-KP]
MQFLTVLRFMNIGAFLFALLARVVWPHPVTIPALPLVPAPFFDAIAGVVFTTLLIWCIRPVRAFPADRELIEDIGGWLALSLVTLGVSSMTGPPWELVWTTISFISLCLVYMKIQYHPRRSPWMRSPFSVLLAWMSTMLLILPFRILSDFQFTSLFGLSEHQWSTVALILAIIGGLLFIVIHSDWVFGLVLVWYLIGLFFNERLGFLQQIVTGLGIVCALLVCYYIFYKRQRFFRQHSSKSSST